MYVKLNSWKDKPVSQKQQPLSSNFNQTAQHKSEIIFQEKKIGIYWFTARREFDDRNRRVNDKSYVQTNLS